MNILLAGYDKETGPHLYFLDYLASLVDLKYAAHGYGGFFSLSIMDRYHLESMTPEEGYDLLKKCVREVHERLIINLPNFKVQLINAEGIKDLDNITAENLGVAN